MVHVPGDRISRKVNRAVLEVFLQALQITLLEPAVRGWFLFVPSPNINGILSGARRNRGNAEFSVFFASGSLVTSVQTHPLALVCIDIAGCRQGPDFRSPGHCHRVPTQTTGSNRKGRNDTGDYHRSIETGARLFLDRGFDRRNTRIIQQERIQEVTKNEGYESDHSQAQETLRFHHMCHYNKRHNDRYHSAQVLEASSLVVREDHASQEQRKLIKPTTHKNIKHRNQ
mmetsp:Transcript_2496/g.5598  ORF Transcript_2496/g.5598 Transcript_2496/m.5598 type:complete len:228 (+) Transcript_2496:1025-1708(+)